MMTTRSIILVASCFALVQFASTLQCYKGSSFIRGQSASGQTETCKKSSDQCLKASAEGSAVAKLKLTGCSTIRCMAIRDKCTEQQIAGHRVQICCCSTDLCNGKQKSMASGFLDKLINRGSNNRN